MTCSYTPARPNSELFLLKWEVQPEKDNDPWRPVATYFPHGKPDIAPSFEGRALVSVDLSTRQSTLQLNNVLMQDSRTFQCSVTIQGDDEGITAATTSLLVLVAPSKPVCSIQGNAEYWNNITLSCLSEEGSPIPTYSWQSYSVQNMPRPLPLTATTTSRPFIHIHDILLPHVQCNFKDGALALYNISVQTSGFFICTSTNRIDSAYCNLTLAVLPTTMKIGATAGIIGGVVAAVVILGIVIYCCCCKKDKKEKYVQDCPVEAVEFQDQPSVRDQYWDDKSSTLTKPYIEDHVEEGSDHDQGNYNNRVGKIALDADQHSYIKDEDGQETGYGSSSDRNRGRPDDKRDYRGSRDRLDDQDQTRGSRDRLDDHRDRYRGSSDRLDDQRDRYRGSRDRLDDRHDDVRGSRDRLDDKHDRYRGSRDRLDDEHADIRGSRDRLDDTRDHHGSRDRLDDHRDRRYGSRDNLDAQYNRRGGSRDRLDQNSYDL
ncbi:Cell surface A33 antigen [Merluccius polli]|uniref:Cell surface A33 antigen n=1 Tax=Merluccius polli TaxID=89951 RepID=A0AA47NXM6_MERPO|nr:Cell surface A33 antigen [Merluccius polli]